jgi:hypothetical protein
LFVEAGEAGGGEYAVFMRNTDGSSAVRLGSGTARALSPDRKWALVLRQDMSPPDFVLLPTGVGQQRQLSTGNVVPNGTGQFFPDSRRILFDGREPGHAPRLYVVHLDGGQPRALTPEGFSMDNNSLSPDGKRIAAVTAEGIALVSVDGGQPQPVPGSQPGEIPLRWLNDGEMLLVGQRGETGCPVSRLDLRTGGRTAWKTFRPADVAGMVAVSCPSFSADGQHYVFAYGRNLSDLFLVEHLE